MQASRTLLRIQADTRTDEVTNKVELVHQPRRESLSASLSTCASSSAFLNFPANSRDKFQRETLNVRLSICTAKGHPHPTSVTASVRHQLAVRSIIHDVEIGGNLQCFLLSQ